MKVLRPIPFILFFFLLAACSCKKGSGQFLLVSAFSQSAAVIGETPGEKNELFYMFWENEHYDSCLVMLQASPKFKFSPLYLFFVARDLHFQGENIQALAVLDRLIREDGKKDEYLFLRAGIHFQRGYFGLADEDYARCSKKGSFKGESLYWRGVIYLQLEKYRDAENFFKAARDEGDRYAKKMLEFYFHSANKEIMELETK